MFQAAALFRRSVFKLVILLWASMAVHSSAGETDELRLHALQHYNTVRCWDNVKGPPLWGGGVSPRKCQATSFHTVFLKPGQEVTVRVPAHSMVRVLGVHQPLGLYDVELWVSDGSGLYSRRTSAISEDARSLLLAPGDGRPCLVRIRRRADAYCGVELAVFTSRWELPQDVVPYQACHVALEPQFNIGSASDNRPDGSYYCLHPARPRAMVVDGPAHIAVETRLRYRPTERRSFQSYHLRTALNGVACATLEYETGAESRPVLVNERREVLGRREVAYLDIPAGSHRLEIDATASVYARLLSYQSKNYLLRLNQPSWLLLGNQSRHRLGLEPLSSWDITRQAVQTLPQQSGASMAAQEQLAYRAARDNGQVGGGMRGFMLLRAAAASWPDAPAIGRAANKLRGFHTYYRDLLPYEMKNGRQQFAWFNTRGIPTDDQPAQRRVIAEQHVDGFLDRLSSGYFSSVGDEPTAASQYRLPTGPEGSLVRVVVDRRDVGAPVRMFLQYDDRDPIELEVTRCERAREASLAEMALASLQWRHGRYDHGTLGGPFSQHRVPAQLIPVATAELWVPADVQEIRLWAPATGNPSPRVALQYRASNAFQLSESEYLAMQRRLVGDEWESFQSLVNGERTSRDGDFAICELSNHWVPLTRFLQSQRRSFESQVVPALSEGVLAAAADEAKVQQVVWNSRQCSTRQDWLPSLEATHDVASRPSASQRRQGLIEQTVALRQLGETFLADRTLRGLYLFDSDPLLRVAAFDELRQIYRQSDSTESLKQLLATTASRAPDPDVLNELTDLLLQNDNAKLALTLSLITPTIERSHDNVLRAAYRLQWWDVFERELQNVSAEDRSYWNAMRMQCEGNYQRAIQYFQLGGHRGQQYATHLAAALDIHDRLQSASIDERVRAIFDWEQWEQNHPGPRVWHDAGALVREHAGTESLLSIDRHLLAQCFKARPDRPLVLRVQGPQNLQFEFRPIHARETQTPQNDWIHIGTIDRYRPIAVNKNRAASGLEIVGDPENLPGRKVQAHLALGPGLHEVFIAADTLPLLVRVYAQRAALPICALPILTPDTLAATTARGLHVTSSSEAPVAAFDLLASRTAHAISNVPVVHQSCEPWRVHASDVLPSDPLLAGRLGLRTAAPLDPYAAHLEDWARDSTTASAKECALALARLGSATNDLQVDRALLDRLPQDAAEALLAAHQDYETLLTLPLPDDDAVRRRGTLLLWLADSEPELRTRCRVLAQQLFHEHPTVDGLAALHNHVACEGTWSRVTQLSSSAGVRKLEWPQWMPEDPSLRVRKSLIGEVDGTERLLFGSEATVLSMRNLAPVQLELSLSPAAVGYLPTKPLRVACQLGELPPQWVFVQRDGPTQQLELEVPIGLQYVRLWVDEPTVNHFVRLVVRELPTSTSLGQSTDANAFHTTERIYDVATHDEPVRMPIEGPAWLRVDELQGDETYSRYIAVLEPEQQVELAPRQGHDEALFRVFEYQPRTDGSVPSVHEVHVAPEPLPPPLIHESDWEVAFDAQRDPLAHLSLLASDSPVISMDVYDSLPLAGQQDGTWSCTLGAFSRRALEEGLNGRAPDRFLETRATRHHYDLDSDVHRRTDLLVRPREMSGPTFGILHRARRPSHCWPVVFEYVASAYGQDPAGAVAPSTNDIEWSTAVRGRIRYRRDLADDLHHTASLSVFGRRLSQDRLEYLAGRVDQDIFTRYKVNHRTGLTLSDTWVYKPWIDTLWWVVIFFFSNEDFNLVKPDQLNLRFGWTQALGLAEVDASYRLTRFFEDRNRRAARLQNLLYLDVVTDIPPWGRRSELAFRVQHDLDRGSSSAQINVTWYFDKGHVDRDRWPGDRLFPALRQQSEMALFGRESVF